MNEGKNKIVDGITDVTGSVAGALAGAGIGAMIAGPAGVAGGALAGTAIEKVFQCIGKEIQERFLSKSESKKIGTVYSCAREKIEINLNSGKVLRNDNFFSKKTNDRSSSEEILEGTIFAAQREHEEKKLPYLANLYANINFDSTINRQMANQLIKIASNITYRQIVILCVVGSYQTNRITTPKRRESTFSGIGGYDKISIASEIFDLYQSSLLFSKSAILDAAGFVPAQLEVSGNGALLYNLMELFTMPLDEIAKEVIDFLSDSSK